MLDPFVIGFPSLGVLAWSQWGPYVYHSADGWCLSHTGESLEFFPNPSRPRGDPEFRIPSNIPLPNLSAEPGQTGLIVGFTPNPTFSTRNVAAHRGRNGCEREPQANGLSRLRGEGLTNCSVRESRDWQNDWFEPTEPFDVMDGVFLRCGRGAAIVNCHMTGLLKNDWEAQITLPKTHLANWRDAAWTATDYFETYLTDCGVD